METIKPFGNFNANEHQLGMFFIAAFLMVCRLIKQLISWMALKYTAPTREKPVRCVLSSTANFKLQPSKQESSCLYLKIQLKTVRLTTITLLASYRVRKLPLKSLYRLLLDFIKFRRHKSEHPTPIGCDAYVVASRTQQDC